MNRFAVVVMLPEPGDDPLRVDFAAREFETWGELATMMTALDREQPDWRVVTLCHVEDLPKLMEPPDGMGRGAPPASGSDDG